MTRTLASILALTAAPLLLAATACGDNRAAPSPDAGADAPVDSAPAAPHAVVVAGTFVAGTPGVLSVLDPVAGTIMTDVGPRGAVGDDPILRHIGHELFVVNRFDGNNVTILDDHTFALVEQLGTGAGSNPQDVAVLGDKLYVAVFGGKGVAVLTRGSTTTTTLDLSAGDPDGKPNCNSIYLVGNSLYVACELLDDTDKNLPPRGPGKVYVVDAPSLTITATLTLGHDNPFGVFEQIPATAPHGGDLVIPTINFSDASGCVERVTPGSAPAASGCLFDNADLKNFDSYASRLAFQVNSDVSIAWAAVPTVFPKSELRAFDMATSMLWSGPLSAPAEAIGDVTVCPTGDVVVTDTTMKLNGLRVYSAGAEVTTAPLAVGLPPASTHGLVCY